MNKLIIVLFFVLLSVTNIVKAEGLKFVGKDYNLLELVDNPYGVGFATWSDDEEDFSPSIYAQMALVSWEDYIRFSLGCASTWKREDDRLGIRPITSITVIFKMASSHIEIGGYFGPFYNLGSNSNSDPYGLMIGWAFNIGEK